MFENSLTLVYTLIKINFMALGGDCMKLYISTFGNFDIRDESTSLLKDAARQYRLYKLFQYFVTFRNKKLLPETIIDNILQDNESADPKNVLRTQIFRLRNILKAFIPEGEDEADYMSIHFVNGYYCLELGKNISLDIKETEDLSNKGDEVYISDKELAKDYFMKAISLYKGQYLADNPYEVWAIPIRNYYSRLYLKTLFKLIEIYKDEDKNDEIIELCEAALSIEPYEENIHIYLMDAMLKLGHVSNAKSHYDYAAAILEKEVGIKSSPRLKSILRKIENYLNEKSDIDISTLDSKLDDKEDSGALFCDADYFKFLYNIQQRRSIRHNENDFIALISLNDYHDEAGIKKWIKIMTELLKYSLRAGDAFTFWNDSQVILLLHDVRDNGRELIENRIRKNLRSYGEYDLKIRFKPLHSGEKAQKALS